MSNSIYDIISFTEHNLKAHVENLEENQDRIKGESQFAQMKIGSAQGAMYAAMLNLHLVKEELSGSKLKRIIRIIFE